MRLYAQVNVFHLHRLIDLFSSYVLFSHFRSRDATRGKKKWKIPMTASRGLKWKNKMYKLRRSIRSNFRLQVSDNLHTDSHQNSWMSTSKNRSLRVHVLTGNEG